jgi:hypothetical protein
VVKHDLDLNWNELNSTTEMSGLVTPDIDLWIAELFHQQRSSKYGFRADRFISIRYLLSCHICHVNNLDLTQSSSNSIACNTSFEIQIIDQNNTTVTEVDEVAVRDERVGETVRSSS